MSIGVTEWKQGFELQAGDSAERDVLYALAALVLHDITLVGEGFAERSIKQEAHARAFQPQAEFELRGGQCFKVVRAVHAGRTVAC